jgi:parvulin-like peptidyl-prolyl isomerase
MVARLIVVLLTAAIAASAVIIDQIAIVIGNSIIKDSDIERDIRGTDFMNGVPLDLSSPARKKAASRLIDQVFIRREIESGDYPDASWKQTDQQIERLERQRFKTQAGFDAALKRYGFSEVDLRTLVQWQLTILSFIDIRFKPAVLVTDEDIQKYYNEHSAELAREHPGISSVDDLREQIRQILTEEGINKQFFAWLDQQRKSNNVQYLEASLK